MGHEAYCLFSMRSLAISSTANPVASATCSLLRVTSKEAMPRWTGNRGWLTLQLPGSRRIEQRKLTF